jgi:lysozyme
MKNIRYYIIGTCLLLVFGLGLYFYSKSTEDSIKGIDVSHYQGNIDWEKINTSEIKFVLIKSTEGETVKDKYFKRNWTESRKKNLFVGAYHRFTLTSNGKNQARNFISMVPKSVNSIPPAIDIESINKSKIKDKSNIIKELKILENELYLYYGKKPIFYLNEYNYYDYIKNNFNNNVWIYDHDSTRPTILLYQKGIWQYTTNGKCHGINGSVDMNYFNGDVLTFEKFIK